MQSKRKIWIIVSGVLLLLLLLGAAALVVRGFLQFSEVSGSLAASKSSLQSLYDQKPFPSKDNLMIEQDNIRVIKQEVADLQCAMGAGQIEPLGQSPAKFITQFWETRNRLLSRAGVAAIKVDKQFDFGFGRHMKGDLPAPQDVPRLTQQLKIVEGICNILYASKISALSALARQEFETGVASTPVPAKPVAATAIDIRNTQDPEAGKIPAGQQYGRWHFVVRFTGTEQSVLAAVNGFANNAVFIVVTRMNLDGNEKIFGKRPTALAKTTEDPEGTAKEQPKTRDYRVVCGRDSMLDATVELDVYQFEKPQPPEGVKGPEGVKK